MSAAEYMAQRLMEVAALAVVTVVAGAGAVVLGGAELLPQPLAEPDSTNNIDRMLRGE